MKSSVPLRSILATAALALLSACGSSELSITRIKPPTKEAAGAGLTANSSRLYGRSGDVSIFTLATDVQSKFFTTGGGPTDIMTILGALDTRLGEIETRAGESDHPCLDATPSDVSISILGESVTAKFQCYDDIGDGFIAFGKDGDTWWVLDATGAANTLAKATTTSNGTDVEIWGTVGVTNSPFDGQSYGAYHLRGNSSTKVFEMTSGGIGFGFCGISLNSDGTDLYIEGSADAAGGACAAAASLCVSTADVSQTSTGCAGAGLSTFGLNKIGRSTSTGTSVNWAASPWYTGSRQTMDGSASDAIHWASKSAITAASVAKF